METLVDAEHNQLIGPESRRMLEGVIRMADMTAGDVMVPTPRMDMVDIDAAFADMLNVVIDTAHSRPSRVWTPKCFRAAKWTAGWFSPA